ncbi:MAG: hypothetical protein ACYTGP_01860 [Planctomycetota bacterium]|jgi:hypothetical protein
MRPLLVAIVLALLATPAASAQLKFWAEFEPVDEGVADLDPLATSTRQAPTDLRMPTGFHSLYHVPDRDDLLMRVNGGLYAVFPRSLYAQSRFGPVPTIPNDTVFHIGPTTVEALAEPNEDVGADRRIERRIDRTYRPQRSARPEPREAASTGTTIVTDHVYRAHRLRALIQRAALAAANNGT